MSPLLKALLCMTLGMTFIPIGDALAKYISSIASFSPGFLAWSRFAIGVVCLLPLAVYYSSFRQTAPGFFARQCVRGFCISMTLVFIISAVGKSPLADVFGAFFIGPVIATVLSVVWLKEPVGWLGWLTVFLGFSGVIMVVQPGGELSTGLLHALIAGVFYGSFLAATRWAAGTGPLLAQISAQMLFGFIFLLPFGVLQLQHLQDQPASTEATLLVLLMGATSAIANIMSIIALKQASAAFLAPIVYLQVVVASIISWMFFKDTPNTLALAGIALIVFTGILKIPQSMKTMRTMKTAK